MHPRGCQSAHGAVIRLPDALGHRRALALAPTGAAAPIDQPPARQEAENTLPPEAGISMAAPVAPAPLLHGSVWAWLSVHSGIPTISATTAEAFVPQMVNFELLGGVNFKKGCYPGQEVVARSQYRGTIKRRLFLAEANGPLHAGNEVFSSTDPDQAAGMVVNAAPNPQASGPERQWSALIELKITAAQDEEIWVGTPRTATLKLQALPYAINLESD